LTPRCQACFNESSDFVAALPGRPLAQAPALKVALKGVGVMAESVYKVIELVGTSTESWEKAAAAAVETAAQTLRDLRVAEVVELDMTIEDGHVRAYRARVKVSFKYDREE
jgi:hypothetical protein